ncbi:lysophospholipid acyltransferase family protein [Lentisphaera marina]|uniref:lysophospholipid acyltransferase family protein n=1 Tax=Lentisphaera marina TaxID=1111041 RepID=UPI002366475D|nr:lysophospholipid acyltransferase family protein [Lentisphaera marina]MDD7985989.1 lysophospholipid acyltransferase family protein [Lentisphaera marina]
MSLPEEAIQGDSYKTEGSSRKLMDKILRLGNLYFYSKAFKPINDFSKICQAGKYDFAELAKHCQRVLKAVEDCGGRVEIDGLDNLANEPRVYVANHMSSLETVTLAYVMQKAGPSIFVIKESLMTYPVFGHIMQGMSCIPMTRNNPIQDLKTLLKQGGEMLKNGTSVIIFPQKTRGVEFIPDEFNSIGCKLARRAGVKIQPFALDTSFWGRGKIVSDYGPITRSSTVRFSFGEGMDIDSKNQKEVHENCVEFIENKLNQWKS